MNTDILMAPPFPDGQIVNDFLRSLFRYGGTDSLSLASQRLLHRKRYGLDGMPSSLSDFHKEIGYIYSDIDTLIDRHTEFNFYCCGLPRHKFAVQKERLIGKFRGPVRLCRLPLLFGVTENRYLSCPECDALQRKAHGYTYVHRKTGAPFVNVCADHGLVMKPKDGCLMYFDEKCWISPNKYQKQMTMKLGKRIAFCMENTVEKSKLHKEDLLKYMTEIGWLDMHGRPHKFFISEFKKFFHCGFSDTRLNIICQSDKQIDNAIRALLNPEKGIHPEWNNLFQWFAEENCIPASRVITKTEAIPVKRSRMTTPTEYPHKEVVVATLAREKTIEKAAKHLKISGSLLRSATKYYSINVNARPKLVDPKMSADIKNAYKKGMTPAQVKDMFGVSTSTVYREYKAMGPGPLPNEKILARNLEEDKSEWLNLRKEYPEASRKELRQVCPRLYMRLYRCANQWLNENQPLKKLTNGSRALPPAELIEKAQQAVSEAERACMKSTVKRVHKSTYRIQEMTKLTEHTMARLRNKGLIRIARESQIDFQVDRLNAVFNPRLKISSAPDINQQANKSDETHTKDYLSCHQGMKMKSKQKNTNLEYMNTDMEIEVTDKMATVAQNIDFINARPAVVAKMAVLRTESVKKVLKLAQKKGSSIE